MREGAVGWVVGYASRPPSPHRPSFFSSSTNGRAVAPNGMEWDGMGRDGTEFYGQNRRFEIFSGILVGERGGGRSLSGQDPLVFSGEGYCPLEVSIRLRDIYGGPVQ